VHPGRMIMHVAATRVLNLKAASRGSQTRRLGRRPENGRIIQRARPRVGPGNRTPASLRRSLTAKSDLSVWPGSDSLHPSRVGATAAEHPARRTSGGASPTTGGAAVREPPRPAAGPAAGEYKI
jgi:hypothetical protein